MLLSSVADDVPPVSGSAIIENIFIAIFIIILLFCSGLMSGSEAAYFSLSPQEKEQIKGSDDKRGRRVITLLSKPNNLLSVILQANSLINILIVLLSNILLSRIFNFNDNPLLEFVICTIIVTFFLVLFGEALPKILGTQKPVSFSKFTSGTLSILRHITLPMDKGINYIVKTFENARPHSNEEEGQKEEEYKYLSDAVDMTLPQNTKQKRLLKNILTLSQKSVAQIMKPRVDVVTIDIEIDNDQVIEIANKCGYSRIPVYKENLDDIRGFLYIKDMVPYIISKKGGDENTFSTTNIKKFDWRKRIREAYFVPGSMKINDLLEELRKRKLHLAIVVDEYGGMDGIVTMEDILEEIVGEISDESDK